MSRALQAAWRPTARNLRVRLPRRTGPPDPLLIQSPRQSRSSRRPRLALICRRTWSPQNSPCPNRPRRNCGLRPRLRLLNHLPRPRRLPWRRRRQFQLRHSRPRRPRPRPRDQRSPPLPRLCDRRLLHDRLRRLSSRAPSKSSNRERRRVTPLPLQRLPPRRRVRRRRWCVPPRRRRQCVRPPRRRPRRRPPPASRSGRRRLRLSCAPTFRRNGLSRRPRPRRRGDSPKTRWSLSKRKWLACLAGRKRNDTTCAGALQRPAPLSLRLPPNSRLRAAHRRQVNCKLIFGKLVVGKLVVGKSIVGKSIVAINLLASFMTLLRFYG